MTSTDDLVLATADGPSPSGLVAGAVLLLVLWLASRARARRLARVCVRYGHAPDPTTVGTRGETCARCGARLR